MYFLFFSLYPFFGFLIFMYGWTSHTHMYYAVKSTLKVQAIKTFGCLKEIVQSPLLLALPPPPPPPKKPFFQFENVDWKLLRSVVYVYRREVTCLSFSRRCFIFICKKICLSEYFHNFRHETNICIMRLPYTRGIC